MMSKYSKFGIDTFNTDFWVMGYIKGDNNDNNNDDKLITIAQLFLWNRQAKNVYGWKDIDCDL